MSTSILTSVVPQARERQDAAFKRLVTASAVASISDVAALLAYGFGNYVTSPARRPYDHPRHFILRPSGGVGLLVLIFIYGLLEVGMAGQSRGFAPPV
jgi:hypothetical protein